MTKKLADMSEADVAERAEGEPKLTIKQDGEFWEVHQDWRIERNLHLRTFATREAAEDFIAEHAAQRQPATEPDDERNDLTDSLASLADPRPSIRLENSSLTKDDDEMAMTHGVSESSAAPGEAMRDLRQALGMEHGWSDAEVLQQAKECFEAKAMLAEKELDEARAELNRLRGEK